MPEHTVLYSGITQQIWEDIKQVAKKYDVEKRDSPDHIFDAREDSIFIWGRDGWMEGYYHGYMWYDEENEKVKLTRASNGKCMSVNSARKLLAPFFDPCTEEEET